MLEIDTLPDTARLVAYHNDWNGERLHLLYELPDGEAVLHDLANGQMFLEQAVDVVLKFGYWDFINSGRKLPERKSVIPEFSEIQTKAPRKARKLEPYDPDAQDGDGDGIVQDGTPWERPGGTRILDRAGQEIERGLNVETRPAGARIVDEDGEPVKYRPSWDGGTRDTIANVVEAEPPSLLDQPAEGSTPLADHGAATLKERGLRTVRDTTNPNPPAPKPAKAPKPAETPDKPAVVPMDPSPTSFETTPLDYFLDDEEVEEIEALEGWVAAVRQVLGDDVDLVDTFNNEDTNFKLFAAMMNQDMVNTGDDGKTSWYDVELNGETYPRGVPDDNYGYMIDRASFRLATRLQERDVPLPPWDRDELVIVFDTIDGRPRTVFKSDTGYSSIIPVPEDHPNYEQFRYELLARELVDGWSAYANRGESKNMQKAAAEVFGLPSNDDNVTAEAVHLEMVRAMHAETQRMLEGLGITDVPLHRGMSFNIDDERSEWVTDLRARFTDDVLSSLDASQKRELEAILAFELDGDTDVERLVSPISGNSDARQQVLDVLRPAFNAARLEIAEFEEAITFNPLNSFSTSRDMAQDFSKHGSGSSIVLSAIVPAGRVVGTPATGFSLLDESEFVVAGGPMSVKVQVEIDDNDALRAVWPLLAPALNKR